MQVRVGEARKAGGLVSGDADVVGEVAAAVRHVQRQRAGPAEALEGGAEPVAEAAGPQAVGVANRADAVDRGRALKLIP